MGERSDPNSRSSVVSGCDQAATWSVRLPAVLIPLAALLVFLPALANEWTGWDDGAYITASRLMTEPDGLARIWTSGEAEQYYPLTFTSFWLEYRLWDDSPSGYHLTNAILHAINTLLLLLFLRSLGLPRWTTCVVALLFAIHPMQVMSVAWIAQRKNVLSCFFCLLASLWWVRFRSDGRNRWYAGCLVAFTAALLSKTAILTLPLSLAALDVLVLRTSPRSTLRRVIPMLVLSGLFAAITMRFEQGFIEDVPPPILRVIIATSGLLFYVWKLLLPVGLVPIYPKWDVAMDSVCWWLPLALLVVGAIALWRGRRRVNGVILYGALHFALLLLPSSGLIAYGNMEETYVSDHFVYVACIGLFLTVATVLHQASSRRTRHARFITGAVAVAFALLAFQTVRYIPVFRNAHSMWTRTLISNPDCYAAHFGLGQYHTQKRAWHEAAVCFQRAHELDPDSSLALLGLGRAQMELGDFVAAEATVQQVADSNPTLVGPVLALAQIVERTGQYDRALGLCQRAVEIVPENADACARLATVHFQMGHADEAAEHFRTAIGLGSSDPRTYLGLATIQRGGGFAEEAVQALRDGLEVVPKNVSLLNLLARILATDPNEEVRNGKRAIEVAQHACELTGMRDYVSLDTWAAAYAEVGRFDDAIRTAEKAATIAQRRGHLGATKAIRISLSAYRERRPLRETATTLTPR